MQKPLFLLVLIISSYVSSAQVSIDKSINLSGSSTNAKISGIDNVSQPKDAVSAEVIQKGSLVYAAATGLVNAYEVTLSPNVTGYTTGMVVNFKANLSNTATATLSINGMTPKNILKGVVSPLTGNDILANQLVSVIYDGASFQLLSRTEYSETDGSITNEGTIGVGAGGASSATLTTNTSGGNAVTLNAGSGLGITESTSANGGSITLNNTAPDQTVTLNAGTNIGVSGSYPTFTISNTGGTVTAVTASNGLNSSGSNTPDIKLGGSLSANTDIALGGRNLTFSGSGRVGIGTTSPSANLEVTHSGTDAWGIALRLNQNQVGNSDGPKLEFRKLLTTGPTEKSWSAGILNGVNQGGFAISENGGIGGFGTPRFAIASGGAVGIGTTTPSSQLEVVGCCYGVRSAYSGSEPGYQLENTESGGRRYDIFVGSSGTYGAPTTYKGYLFIYDRTATTDRMVIANNGNIGIGTANPSYKLDVNGTISGQGGTDGVPYIQNVHAVGLLQHHDGNKGYAPNTWHQLVLGDNTSWAGNHDRLYLRRTDNSYGNEIKVNFADGTPSNRKWKKNIVQLSDSVNYTYLDKLLQTTLYEYEFIHDPYHIEGLKYIGFMADEIPAEMQMPRKDGVQIGSTFAMMVGAIKVLKEENDLLKARLALIEEKFK